MAPWCGYSQSKKHMGALETEPFFNVYLFQKGKKVNSVIAFVIVLGWSAGLLGSDAKDCPAPGTPATSAGSSTVGSPVDVASVLLAMQAQMAAMQAALERLETKNGAVIRPVAARSPSAGLYRRDDEQHREVGHSRSRSADDRGTPSPMRQWDQNGNLHWQRRQ